MRKQWLIVVAATLGVALLAFVRAQDSASQEAATQDSAAQTAEAPAAGGTIQPIQFPHDVHAGTYQMQCLYCHFSATRSVDAGIPPVGTCMGCHMVVTGTEPNQQAEIQKLAGYFQRGEQIPWTRIYKVRDHVHFPHLRHVNAGVTCQTCHTGDRSVSTPISWTSPWQVWQVTPALTCRRWGKWTWSRTL